MFEVQRINFLSQIMMFYAMNDTVIMTKPTCLKEYQNLWLPEMKNQFMILK
jgi:hypothetical protein